MGVVETWLFVWLDGEDILHCVGDHVNGEGWWWVRRVKLIEEFVDHVGRKGVKKNGASFGIGDGLLP